MAEFADGHPEVKVRTVAADLSTSEGVDRVAGICATVPLTLLANDAGVAHYMPLAGLPAGKAAELMNVKVLAPTMLASAPVAGMQERGAGTIVNVAGMIAFSGPAPRSQMSRRVVYAGTLAYLVAMSQTLSAELEGTGVAVQVVCPGVVATEFHERQGLDLSAVPRMSADDVVTAGLRGLQLGETVCAPGVEDTSLLDAVFQAGLSLTRSAAGQPPAARCGTGPAAGASRAGTCLRRALHRGAIVLLRPSAGGDQRCRLRGWRGGWFDGEVREYAVEPAG